MSMEKIRPDDASREKLVGSSDTESNLTRCSVSVERGQSKNVRSRLMYFLTAVAVLLSVANLVLTIVVVTKQNSEQTSGKQQALIFPDGVCVPCIKLILDPYEPSRSDNVLDKLDKKLTSGVQMCCAYTADQMSAMLECAIREQVTRPVPAPPSSPSSLKFVPASVHKKLLPPDPNSKERHIHMKFDVSYTDATEHVRGVQIKDEEVVISYTGLYYIYVTIHFKSDVLPLSINNQSVFQYVERVSPNSPANSGLLLQNAHTLCRECTKREETAFTGGVFYLKAGDALRVCVSEAAAHGHSTDISSFGLMMLASDDNGKLTDAV